MKNLTNISEDVVAIGASDRRLSRFENLFPLPHGVSYNNYVLLDEKTVLMDTSDTSVADQFMENLKAALNGRPLDYLVIQHMEPDHASAVASLLALYPGVTVVSSKAGLTMLGQFFPAAVQGMHAQEVKEGDALKTGRHTLHFVAAPMVHWPEVIMTYDETDRILFSADAFGTFGAVDGSVFADEHDFDREYLDDARRYYANIVGKFGPQVQCVLKKAAKLDIAVLCPLHGPVWRKDLGRILDLYEKWSTYVPESDDTLIVYGTLYGHTASAAEAAAAQIRAKSGKKVAVYDVSETDVSYLISEVWRCGKIVLFCPTYNMGIYPKMESFLCDMAALHVQDRTFAVAENGTWAPAAGRLIAERLSCLKNVRVLENRLTIRSALTEKDAAALEAFTDAVAKA
ncbi:MAG: FprA family A-type flavoprotein [Lachnospiraceae bacterium]|nr:FprA family A-type flavoprotein [Lachnospiraceae bacterium]